MQATVDQTTGEVVGGLAGLREIIRLRQELDNGSDSQATKENTNTTSSTAPVTLGTTSSSVMAAGSVRKSRRRNRRRSGGGNKNDDGANQSAFVLPIEQSQIVYAEIIGTAGSATDVRMYVSGDDRLYVHTAAVYADRLRDYCAAAQKLLVNQAMFDMAKVANVQLFINKRVDLTVAEDFLIYKDKYRIDSSSEKVYRMAKQILNDRNKVDDANRQSVATNEDNNYKKDETVVLDLKSGVVRSSQGEINLPTKKLRQAARETDVATQADADPSIEKEGNTEHAVNELSIVDKVIRIQELATEAAAGKVDISAAMEVFLLVGEASPDLLVQLLHIDHAAAMDLVDQLRLMHAVGYKVNDDEVAYPILIDSLTELGKDVSYTLQSTEGNFHSVVDTANVRGKELYYDLDAVFAVQMADEYMHRVAEFCRITRSHRIGKLFSSTAKRVAVSDVLRVVSADDENGDVRGGLAGDMALFHDYVTGGMLRGGWLISNPSDGYPWVQFQVDRTEKLATDTLRYIIVNAEWLVASYDAANTRSLIAQIERLDLTEVYHGLQAATVAKLRSLLDQADGYHKGAVDAGQLSLDNFDAKSSDEDKRGDDA